MAETVQRQGRGFWAGLFTGLLAGLAGLLVLALMHPPAATSPPALEPEAMEPPPGPAAPSAVPSPDGPDQSTRLIPSAPEMPLIGGSPTAEAPPELPGLAPRIAEDRFRDSESGSPSLFPADEE